MCSSLTAISTAATSSIAYYPAGTGWVNYGYTKCPRCGYCGCCGRDDEAGPSKVTGGYLYGKCGNCGYCSNCQRDDRSPGASASSPE